MISERATMILSKRGMIIMKFEAIVRNWLGLYGNFDEFPINEILPRANGNKNNLCYYATGILDTGSAPQDCTDAFAFLVAYLQGEANKNNSHAMGWIEKYLNEDKKITYGCLALHNDKYTASENNVVDILTKYFCGVDNTHVSVSMSNGVKSDLTIFQYLHAAYNAKEKVTVEKLCAMELVNFQKCATARSTYMIGHTVYSPISESKFNEILDRVYDVILNICTPSFFRSLPDFPCLVLAECSKQTVSQHAITMFLLSAAKAKAINMTLSQLLSLFGLKMVDAWYSLKHFGSLIAVMDDETYIQLMQNGLVQSKSLYTGITGCSDPISLDFDLKAYNATLNQNVGITPERMAF